MIGKTVRLDREKRMVDRGTGRGGWAEFWGRLLPPVLMLALGLLATLSEHWLQALVGR
ncbi:MAG TPA: hypothetical protein VM536_01870 [Chloroflexia bacterium]|nr:hypothetical protein [Chloroflexia bacterium]